MQIHRHGAGPTARPPESSFTGDVFISGFGQREAPSRMVGAAASFGPRARTPWKVNPFGQTLVVTSGVGWAQCEGEDIVEVRAGDWIWCPPGQRHWEGATPDHEMTYIALHEGYVQFTGPVTDEEYDKGTRAASDLRSGGSTGTSPRCGAGQATVPERPTVRPALERPERTAR